MQVRIMKEELSLTMNSLNVKVEDLASQKLFYASRLGNDLVTWNMILEMKDYTSTTPSSYNRMFWAATMLLQKMQAGTMRTLLVDGETGEDIDLFGLTKDELKKLARNYMGEIGLEFLQRSSINNQNMPFEPLQKEMILRTAAKYGFMGTVFGHYRQRLVFTNVANGRTDVPLVAKRLVLSAPPGADMVLKLDVPPGFYPSIDKFVLQKVLSDTDKWGKEILHGKTVDFAFTTQLRSSYSDRWSKEVVIYGLKDGEGNIEIHYSDYWDITNVYNAKKFENMEQNPLGILKDEFLEEVFYDNSDASIGKDVFIDLSETGTITVKENINPLDGSVQDSWVGIYRPDRGDTIYASIAPSSFYEPVRINGENYLILKDNNDNPIIIDLAGNPIGFFDLSRGLLATLKDGNSEIDFEVIKDIKQQMYRFYTTRTVPVMRTIPLIGGTYEAGIAYEDISIAIKTISETLEGIHYDNIECKIVTGRSESEYKAIYEKLQKIGSLHSEDDFNLEALYWKLTDTLNYYIRLETEAPHIELFSQEVGGQRIADPLFFLHQVTVSNEYADFTNFNMGTNHYKAYFEDEKYIMYDFDGYYLHKRDSQPEGSEFYESALLYRSLAIELVDHVHLRTRSSSVFMREYTKINHLGEGTLANAVDVSARNKVKLVIQKTRDLLEYGFLGTINKDSMHFETILVSALKAAGIILKDGLSSEISLKDLMEEYEDKILEFLKNHPVFGELYRRNMLSITKHDTTHHTNQFEGEGLIKMTWINADNFEGGFGKNYLTFQKLFSYDEEHIMVNYDLFKHYNALIKTDLHDFCLKLENTIGSNGIKTLKNAISTLEKHISSNNYAGRSDSHLRTIWVSSIDTNVLLSTIKVLSVMDAVYKSTYKLCELAFDSRYPICNAHDEITEWTTRVYTNWKPEKRVNTYLGYRIDKTDETMTSWKTTLYQKDYNIQNERDVYYKNYPNFNTIWESRILMPAAVVKIDPSDPNSDTILINAFKEALIEYEISSDYQGLSKDIKLENGKRKYNIEKYNPEDMSWFKNLYERWIRIFAGKGIGR